MDQQAPAAERAARLGEGLQRFAESLGPGERDHLLRVFARALTVAQNDAVQGYCRT